MGTAIALLAKELLEMGTAIALLAKELLEMGTAIALLALVVSVFCAFSAWRSAQEAKRANDNAEVERQERRDEIINNRFDLVEAVLKLVVSCSRRYNDPNSKPEDSAADDYFLEHEKKDFERLMQNAPFDLGETIRESTYDFDGRKMRRERHPDILNPTVGDVHKAYGEIIQRLTEILEDDRPNPQDR